MHPCLGLAIACSIQHQPQHRATVASSITKPTNEVTSLVLSATRCSTQPTHGSDSRHAGTAAHYQFLLLPLLLLPDAMHNLLEANKIVAATCESQQQHLYFQRNALISGGR
jgi:hypothetical protein